jgi:hypothetical protein
LGNIFDTPLFLSRHETEFGSRLELKSPAGLAVIEEQKVMAVVDSPRIMLVCMQQGHRYLTSRFKMTSSLYTWAVFKHSLHMETSGGKILHLTMAS